MWGEERAGKHTRNLQRRSSTKEKRKRENAEARPYPSQGSPAKTERKRSLLEEGIAVMPGGEKKGKKNGLIFRFRRINGKKKGRLLQNALP